MQDNGYTIQFVCDYEWMFYLIGTFSAICERVGKTWKILIDFLAESYLRFYYMSKIQPNAVRCPQILHKNKKVKIDLTFFFSFAHNKSKFFNV